MPITKTFIKMCDCPEIQGLRPISHYNRETKVETKGLWQDGDWFCADGTTGGLYRPEPLITSTASYSPYRYAMSMVLSR